MAMLFPFGSVGAATGQNISIDSTNDWLCFRVIAPNTTPIAKVELFGAGYIGAPGNLNLVLTSNVNGKPNGTTDIGGGSPTATTYHVDTMGGGKNDHLDKCLYPIRW
jgi:hypothetical protein